MGINEDRPNEESKGDIYRTCYTASASVPVTCVLAQTQRQAEQWEHFTVGKEGATWRALTVGRGPGAAVGRLTRSGAPCS